LLLKRLLKYILVILLPLAAQAEPPSLEFQVKSAFLVNFVKFIEWPGQGPHQAQSICLVGENPFGDSLTTLASQAGGDHPLSVTQLSSESLATEFSSCNLVYLSGPNKELSAKFDKLRAGRAVITVSEESGDGLIHFVIVDGKVRFSIDNSKISALGARVSSKLLNLALPQ